MAILSQQFFHQRRALRADAVVFFFLDVVLAQRVSYPIFRQHDASQIAVALKNDTEQIVNLALEPVRDLPHAFDRSDFWIGARQIDLEDNLMIMRIGEQMVNDLDLKIATVEGVWKVKN